MAVVVRNLRMTVEDFDQFVELPENADKRYEFIGGEAVEVPSNAYSSYIVVRILWRLAMFVELNNLGYVTGEGGGYRVYGDRYAPDVAFLRKGKTLSKQGYNPDPPDLAVEVLSPGNTESEMSLKVVNYMNDGATVWVVDYESKTVDVFVPGQKAVRLTEKDTLDGGTVLPGFTLPVKDIFPAHEEHHPQA
ncbi:MAG: Uma2 family endonuclease [Anaerolineae bacterium]|nr:Uma2 family endonuclease [Anaerolineae bacterium]